MCILDYIVVRFDPNCAAASINKYQRLDQTVDLKDEVMFTIRAALDNPDCGQVIVIITRNPQQLQSMQVLAEYMQRGAKFLCLSATQDERDLVIWLNDELARTNSLSRVYIAVAPEPPPKIEYRGRGTLQVVGRATRALPTPAVKALPAVSTTNKPWYGKHSKQR
jgi:hypothetical protein